MTSTENSSHSERSSALRAISTNTMKTTRRTTKEVAPAISEYFGENTFGLGQMRERLPHSAYQDLLKALEQGKKLSKESADAIAQVIKEWAVTKGATHFCHWFQPMTGLTAEKHDAFISIQHSHHSELKVVERFTGSMLIQGEPDASSFPSGGMRSTFEARGYTAWDPSSPIFLIESESGRTLCIPTVFFGYHGQALDLKTPMLRSVQALSAAACAFLKVLGDVDVKKVTSTLGVEQEYFLVDKRFVALRPDLLLTGRTLLGASSPRHQQLEDHYFGSIPERVKAFMEDAETELYKLGIPVKTRHNEVAPSQFELAPIFEDASIAADHNTLLMETMKRVALRHGLVCLMHEKPFAGINGNGKHCNWAMSNDKGENLLDPGSTPHQNLRFLAITAVVMKAVHDHSDALRASIASTGNDHRLGGNEAPPAIISVFLGSLLSKICDDIESGKASAATESQIVELGVSHIPTISRDYTDRNRTSPFAFTGNKFEFRAVGGSANVAVPVATLNAAVAGCLMDATEKLKDLLSKKGRDEAVMELIREYLKASRPVRFEGNNYSAEWQAEAKKRGLPVLNSTAEALQVWNQPKSVEFLTRAKVLSKDEIHSRFHVAVERYNKTLLIEHHTLAELVATHVIPAVESQMRRSHGTATALTAPSAKTALQKRAGTLETTFTEILGHLESLKGTLDKVAGMHDETEAMKYIASDVTPTARKLRTAADAAETQVADDLWPLPKYREMLFAFALS